MKRNNFYSYNKGNLCKGCKLCVQGKKTVVYITGLCPRECFYCPLSEQKKNKDVVYANERVVNLNNINEEIYEEIKLCSSKGIGITGGDPLLKINRTLNLIKFLKDKLGNEFHIHLYTSLDLINNDNLNLLYEAGLDEIRVHPDLYNKNLWHKLELLNKFKGKKGIEIPAITGKSKIIKELYIYSKNIIDFFNINEFEYSDSNCDILHSYGFYCHDENTYAIKGSKEMGMRILNSIEGKIPIHFCTAKLKDATQISNRLKLRAINVKKKYDIINEEGILIKGVIEGDVKKITNLLLKYNIPKDLFEKDNDKILIASWIIDEIYEELPFKCSIRLEYPTADRMIVDVIPLN